MNTRNSRILSRALSAVVAVGTVGAVTLATPAIASASDFVHVDQAHDVRTGHIDGDGPGRLDRREGRVDVRRVRISYDADRLVVRVKTRRALPTTRFFLYVPVRTPATVFESGYSKLAAGTDDSLSHNGDPVDCAGYGTTFDRAKRLATITIPSTCIGSPAWVRVGVGAVTFKGRHRMSVDDGLSRRVRGNLTLSPRVTRD